MSKPFRPFVLGLVLAQALSLAPCAFGADEIEAQETAEAKSPLPQETWASEVKTKYSLTDAQMKTMTDAGMHGPQLAITAELAKASGKPIEDIVRMRTTDKMGWGKIAKELGLPPGTIGKSVAALRHDIRDRRADLREEKREEKQAKREEKREERNERREARREQREQRKEQQKNAH